MDHRGIKAKLTKFLTLTMMNQRYDERYERCRSGARDETPLAERDQIAIVADGDGVKGRWDKPPTGNAMRGVWARVCQEAEERKARKQQTKQPTSSPGRTSAPESCIYKS